LPAGLGFFESVCWTEECGPNLQSKKVFVDEQIRQELQQDLVHRSPSGKQIVATRSGHYIQRDEPELVVSAIREVIDATRKQK